MPYLLVRKTWTEGADPEAEPDHIKAMFRTAVYEEAVRRAEALVRRYGACGRDPVTGTWWGRAPDALHRFEVRDE
jgi:hypothetical protein